MKIDNHLLTQDELTINFVQSVNLGDTDSQLTHMMRDAILQLQKELAELKASLPQLKADAVNSFELPEMDNINEWHHIDGCLKEHADKLEAGNE